ncbi:MAG: cysteine desulfurase family protein [Bacteroidota bacterium]
MQRVYLDNAASTPMDPAVFEHMKPYLLAGAGNPSSTHAHGRELRNTIEQARRTIAKHLGANPLEIYFTSGGTEADNMVIFGAVEGLEVKHIISTRIEHHAVTHPLEHLESTGQARITWLEVNQEGHIDLNELETALQTADKTLVCLMHGNNEIGTLHPIAEIGQLCRQHGAYFHSDTVQSIGTQEINVQEIEVDFMAASAHKFYGPKGVGFLYMRKGIRLPALIQGGAQERGLRAGTENPASIAGMAFAFDRCVTHRVDKVAHLVGLKEYMRGQLLMHFPGVQFNGDQDPSRCLPTVLNVTLPCDDKDCMLLFSLDLAGVSASGGSACSSGAVQGSHVLTGIGANQNTLKNAIRFSFGMQNTRADIDFAIQALKDLVPQQVLS